MDNKLNQIRGERGKELTACYEVIKVLLSEKYSNIYIFLAEVSPYDTEFLSHHQICLLWFFSH